MAIKKSDLYSSLWASCDELRGGMDASQYKDYVLFMLFIKYVSDKYGNSDDFAPPVTIPTGASFTDMVALKGIHDAIARKLNEKGKLSTNAVAEGIINNVRKTIIRDQLTDPRFYAEMSQLLDDLITQSRADTVAYEAFLKKAEDLVKRLANKSPTAGVPAMLHGNTEASVRFNNLATIPATTFQCPADEDAKARLALEIDLAMREQAPAGFKEDLGGPRGKQVLNALFPIMSRDRVATQAIFDIIKNQPGYE